MPAHQTVELMKRQRIIEAAAQKNREKAAAKEKVKPEPPERRKSSR